MKVMIFNDKDNFERCLNALNKKREEGKKRFWKIEKYHNFIFDKIKSIEGWNSNQIDLVRAYIYTGEYKSKTLYAFRKYCRDKISEIDNIIKKEEKLLSEISEEEIKEDIKEKVNNHVNNLKNLFETIKQNHIKNIKKQTRNAEGQKKLFEIIERIPFTELKTTDLKHGSGIVYQKGTDVQIATDIIHFAHSNSYDIALILGGDADLIQSIRLAKKGLGKIIILVAYFDENPIYSYVSPNLIREVDYFINLRDLLEEEIQKMSEPRIEKKSDE